MILSPVPSERARRQLMTRIRRYGDKGYLIQNSKVADTDWKME